MSDADRPDPVVACWIGWRWFLFPWLADQHLGSLVRGLDRTSEE